MVLSVISLIFSFLLQGFVSNFQSFTIDKINMFSSVFLLINFVVLYQYFENDKKFLLLVVIFGILFDIVYTNTFVLCTAFFILLFFLNKIFNFFFPSNVVTVNLFSFLLMIIYHVLSFVILSLLNFDSYSFFVLLKVIISCLFMNIIYTTFLYYVIKFFYEKFDLKIVRI